MNQHAHKIVPEVHPAVAMAEELFDLQYADIQDGELINETAVFHGYSFNYELTEMYSDQVSDQSAIVRNREFSCAVPNAADDGDTFAVTVESIKVVDGRTAFVVYEVYQPEYNDENWVCTGTLSFTLTTPETHEALLEKAIDGIRKSTEAMAVSLAKNLVESVASDPEAKARIVSQFLTEMTAKLGYAYDRKKDAIVPVEPMALYFALEKVREKAGAAISKSWAGAMLGSLLLDHPLVESFIVEFSTSDEYDDNNYYSAKHAEITDVVFKNQVPSVRLEDDGDVEVDAFGYAEIMQQGIEDCEWDLYDGFAADPDGNDEFMVRVCRSDLQQWLDADVVDSIAVGNEIARTMECVR